MQRVSNNTLQFDRIYQSGFRITALMSGLFLLNPGQVTYGATFEVTPTQRNSHAMGTKTLNSIAQAIELARAGDTIYLHAGEYFEDIKTIRSGEKNSPIRLTGDRAAVVHGNNAARIVEIRHDYIELSGFTIDGRKAENHYAKKLIYVVSQRVGKGVTGLSIKDMLLQNAADECLRLRYLVSGAEVANNIIQNCGIEDFRQGGAGKNGEAIYLGTAPEQLGNGISPDARPDTSHDNWIHHNTIASHANECVDIKESAFGNKVEYNLCTDQQDPDSAGISVRGHDNIINNNEIRNCVGSGIRLGGDDPGHALNNRVENNRIAGCARGGIKVQSWPQRSVCGNQVESSGGKAGTGRYRDEVDVTADCPEA